MIISIGVAHVEEEEEVVVVRPAASADTFSKLIAGGVIEETFKVSQIKDCNALIVRSGLRLCTSRTRCHADVDFRAAGGKSRSGVGERIHLAHLSLCPRSRFLTHIGKEEESSRNAPSRSAGSQRGIPDLSVEEEEEEMAVDDAAASPIR